MFATGELQRHGRPAVVTSQRILGNNYAHVILTAKADSLPTDKKELLDDYGLVGCHSSRYNDLSVHARIDSSEHVRLSWESDDDRKGHAAIFEVMFGKRSKKAVTQLPRTRERTIDKPFDHLEFVTLTVDGNDDLSEPTSRCVNDTKKRQLVTRSGHATCTTSVQ